MISPRSDGAIPWPLRVVYLRPGRNIAGAAETCDRQAPRAAAGFVRPDPAAPS